MIVASLFGLLWEIRFPQQPTPAINWATNLMSAALIFYLRLSMRLAIGMAICFALLSGLIASYPRIIDAPIWIPSLVLFIVAWIGQIVGHKIEAEKPAFFEDLQYLLIGPAWVLNALYHRIGL